MQDQVDGLNNPPGDCSTWTLGDNATHQQIDECLQGYEDSYNYFCAKDALRNNHRAGCVQKIPEKAKSTDVVG